DSQLRHQRRLPAADLDDPLGLEMPHHVVKELGIAGAEVGIVIAEDQGTGLARYGEQLVAIVKLGHQRQLTLGVQIEAENDALLVEWRSQIGWVGERRIIEMAHWIHAQSVED